MQVHQLSVNYEQAQDRILARINTTTGDELRVWLTRRLCLNLWPSLNKAVAEHVVAAKGPQGPGRHADGPCGRPDPADDGGLRAPGFPEERGFQDTLQGAAHPIAAGARTAAGDPDQTEHAGVRRSCSSTSRKNCRGRRRGAFSWAWQSRRFTASSICWTRRWHAARWHGDAAGAQSPAPAVDRGKTEIPELRTGFRGQSPAAVHSVPNLPLQGIRLRRWPLRYPSGPAPRRR